MNKAVIIRPTIHQIDCGDISKQTKLRMIIEATYYAPAPNRRGIKRCFCLTSVCLTSVAYIGPKSRTERLRKTRISTEVAHVTRDSDTTFRVKGQGHQAALVGCSSHYMIYMVDTMIIACRS